MRDFSQDTLQNPKILFVFLGIGLGVSGFLIVRLASPLMHLIFDRFTSIQANSTYQSLVKPNISTIQAIVVLALLNIAIHFFPDAGWINLLEILISFILITTVSWLASRLFKAFFDIYVLNAAVKSKRKLSSELFILLKWLVNLVIILLAILIFAQSHQINVLGLLASLGIGGLAVAFAAQKTLEQVLGGIVLYLDRPFVIDDYIGLADGTFGRVESIGLRSTKIRTSGKGTLMIVPNSVLTQINIENFTGAKKVISLLHLIFLQPVDSEQQALIRQVILESTNDIFGIDFQNTEVTFKSVKAVGETSLTQAQVTFFILGSGEVSMELRRQLLNLATRTITHRLQEYGIVFEIEEPTVYVDSPITI